MSILIFLIVAYVLFSITMVKLFELAGVERWKALVPGLNFVEMSKLVGRKSGWYALWLLFPIVNIFIFVGLCRCRAVRIRTSKNYHGFLCRMQKEIVN